MKRYTNSQVASMLGVDIRTLRSWLAEARFAVSVDPQNPDADMIDQWQVEQIARMHNLPVPPGVVEAGNTDGRAQPAGLYPAPMPIEEERTAPLGQSRQMPAAPPQGGSPMPPVGAPPQGSIPVGQPMPQQGSVPMAQSMPQQGVPAMAPVPGSTSRDLDPQPAYPLPAQSSYTPAMPEQVARTAGLQEDQTGVMRRRSGEASGLDGEIVDTQGTNYGKDVPDVPPIPLNDSVITLGRYDDNTVVLKHPQVSAHHARLEKRQDQYRIVDLKSTNHTYVNSERVKRHKDLKPGDEIQIGPYILTYTGDHLTQQDDSLGIRVDAIHLRQKSGPFTTLLEDISLNIPPHTFVALVGGSGVGKSTLLNALSGLQPATKGTVLFNGKDYYRNLDTFNSRIGYVPQDDIIHKNLSVDHALYYAAKLRLPKDFTRSQIKERIAEVLEDVEMTHRRRSRVGRLSGGERKRVSIALELLAKPSIFFLDEPTSGLDPGLDHKMMMLLRRLVKKGHTIVLVTHTVNDIYACDYVCFLARGGHMAFYGPPEEAKAYFKTDSFAEIYNLLEPSDEDKDLPQRAEDNFLKSAYYQRYIGSQLAERPEEQRALQQQNEEFATPPPGRAFKQFTLLSRRYLELLRNDFGNLLLLFLQAPLIGLILWYLAGMGTFNATSIANCPLRSDPTVTSGPVVSRDCQKVVDLLNTPQGAQFIQQQGMTKEQALQNAIEPNSGADAQTLLFVMAFAGVMFGCINGAREIVKEVPIYRRERLINLRISSYMFSKIVPLGVLCLIQSAILVFMVNLKAPFHQGILLPPLWEIYITLCLTSLTGLMIGLTISAIAPNTDRAMSFVPLALLPQVIFSGIIFKLDTPLLQGLGALFAARWSMAAMGSTVGLHSDKLGVDSFAYQGDLFMSLNHAADQNAAIAHLGITWGALVAMIVILGFVIAFFLRRKDIRR